MVQARHLRRLHGGVVLVADTHRLADVDERWLVFIGAGAIVSCSWKAALVRELGVARVVAAVV